MTNCWFCGPTTSPISPEDLLPTWLSRFFRRDLGITRFHHAESNRQGQFRRHPPTQRMRVEAWVVCRQCNTTWMSQLERATKPLLVPIIKDPSKARSLSDEDAGTIAIWAILKAILVDARDVALHKSKPFVSPHQRARFMNDLTPPDRCSVWLARQDFDNNTAGRLVADFWIFPRVSTLRHLQVLTVTLSALQLAIQVMVLRDLAKPKPGALHYIPDEAFRIRPKNRPWSDYLVPLHPGCEPVTGPPPRRLGQKGLNALAYRLSGGPGKSPYRK